MLFATANIWAQQHTFRRYSIEEDLPRAGVYDIIEDSRGYIWIGTEGGGVTRFDGYSFQTYNTQDGLCSNSIRCIFEDSFGNLWFGSDNNGVSRFDGTKFTNITKREGLSSNIVRAINEDQDHNLWLGTEGGGINRFSLFQFNTSGKVSIEPEEITTFTKDDGLSSNLVRVITKDQHGRLWIGADGGLSVWVNERFYTYEFRKRFPNRIILDIFESKEGNIWIGTENGAIKFDGRQFHVFSMDRGLIHNRVKSITQDTKGNLWFGTLMGVSKFDGESFTSYTKVDGLSNDRIRKVFADSFGNVWLASYFGGVMKYSGDLFSTFKSGSTGGLASDQVTCIETDLYGNVWFGTWERMAIMRKHAGLFVAFIENGSLMSDRVNTMYSDLKHRMWVATSDGITIYDVENFNMVLKQLPIYSVTEILMPDTNNLWLGTSNGLINYKIDNLGEIELGSRTVYTEDDGMSGRRVSAIASDSKGNLWIGFSDGGLTVYSGTHYLGNPSLSEIKHISSIVTHENEVWVGTENNGIYSFLLKDDGSISETPLHITKESGLTSEQISLLSFDKAGRLWAGTKNGIALIDQKDSMFVKHFGYQEGFSGVETMDNSVAIDSAGNIWFGTIRGAVRLNKNAELNDTIKPRTHITNLKIGFKDEDWEEFDFANGRHKWANLPINLRLPYDQRNLTFEFRGLSYRQPEKIKYKWKLEGFDEEWSPVTTLNQATYGNLPSGEYMFKVISSNGDGKWNHEPASFAFSVKEPFWQTFTFYFLLLSGILFIFIIGYQIKVYRLAKAKNELEIEVASRTLELEQEKEIALMRKSHLEEKNQELQRRNKEVTSSLQYAYLLQSAILENDYQLAENFPNSFIIYQPKDIVSGDFYWFRKTENSLFVGAADGTGHGVPGAFMSIVGHNALEQAINQNPHASPNKILEHVDELIFNTMQSSSSSEHQKDGIDMALCKISLHHHMFEYAGAMRPLIIVRDGAEEYERVLPDRTGLGTKSPAHKFTNHTVTINPKDRVFIFSDGYADQFGGPKGRKFMTKRFFDLLRKSSEHPIEEQRTVLLRELITWTGMQEQIDDILIIGVEFD